MSNGHKNGGINHSTNVGGNKNHNSVTFKEGDKYASPVQKRSNGAKMQDTMMRD